MNHSLVSTTFRKLNRNSKRGLLATFVVLTALAVNSMPFGAATQGNQRKRVIEETPYPDAPVKIVGVLNRNHKIKFKESFSDDDDWIKGLAFEVVNQSEKTVTHVGIDLVLERPSDEAGLPPSVWPLTYGLNPFWLKPDEPVWDKYTKPIRPGEKAFITLSDLNHEDLKDLLKETNFSHGVDKMTVFVTTIGFDDKTAWGGSYYIRDPSAPNGWSPKRKATGSTKRSAAFPFCRIILGQSGPLRRG